MREPGLDQGKIMMMTDRKQHFEHHQNALTKSDLLIRADPSPREAVAQEMEPEIKMAAPI